MGYQDHHEASPSSVGVAILTISDTKGPDTDTSGDAIAEALQAGRHRVTGRAWTRDDMDGIRRQAERLLLDPLTDALITSGGTGVTPRDVTVEALQPRFAKELPGFGEHFRRLSADAIGSGAILSRATAGLWRAAERNKPVFLLPGAPDACRLAVRKILNDELGHLVQLANQEAARHA